MCLDNIYVKLKNLHNYVLFEDNVCSKCVRYIVKQANANPTIQDRGSWGHTIKGDQQGSSKDVGKIPLLKLGHGTQLLNYSLYLSYTLDNIFMFENVSRKRNTWWFLGDPGQIFHFFFLFLLLFCVKKS